MCALFALFFAAMSVIVFLLPVLFGYISFSMFPGVQPEIPMWDVAVMGFDALSKAVNSFLIYLSLIALTNIYSWYRDRK
jgi:hypothetical protein